MNFEDLGLQQVKNIAESIRAYRRFWVRAQNRLSRSRKSRSRGQDLRETSNRYDKLASRVSPLLYRRLEDVLRRHAGTVKSGGELNLSASVLTSDILKSVGTSFPPGHFSRQHERKLGEGVQGYLPERKLLVLCQQLETANLLIVQFLIDSGSRLPNYPGVEPLLQTESGLTLGQSSRGQRPTRGPVVLSELLLFTHRPTMRIVYLRQRSSITWLILSQLRCRHIWMLYKSSWVKRSNKVTFHHSRIIDQVKLLLRLN